MYGGAILRILGVLLMVFSITMLPPIGVSLWYEDGEVPHFTWSMLTAFVIGLVLWFPVRGRRRELRTRDGFVIVAMFWIVLGVLSTLPFMFGPHLSFTDAVFESFSGFTTTGATVIVGLDHLPQSILYYRQQLQWVGGMGIVVLAVAILPMLGVGGMQLYRAETPGPMKDAKLTPRIGQTARALWYIYVALTVGCAFAYWWAGMSPFDAICHSFATISTGGFSTHDASLGFFRSTAVDVIAIVFMLLGGINFGVHFTAWSARSLRGYLLDTEVRTFILGVLVIAFLFGLALLWLGAYRAFGEALRFGAFQVVSIVTSTGFTTTDFSLWPLFLPTGLIMVSFIGGCAGSTAGGIKVIRILLVAKQALREVRALVHPGSVMLVKVGRRVLPERVVDAVWGFFAAYVATFTLIMLLVMMTGVDQVTAFSAVATCINNTGPGLGEVSLNFQSVNATAKWLLALAMLLGRLEIFSLLVLLAPSFWRS